MANSGGWEDMVTRTSEIIIIIIKKNQKSLNELFAAFKIIKIAFDKALHETDKALENFKVRENKGRWGMVRFMIVK